MAVLTSCFLPHSVLILDYSRVQAQKFKVTRQGSFQSELCSVGDIGVYLLGLQAWLCIGGNIIHLLQVEGHWRGKCVSPICLILLQIPLIPWSNVTVTLETQSPTLLIPVQKHPELPSFLCAHKLTSVWILSGFGMILSSHSEGQLLLPK